MGNYRFKLSDMIPNSWFYKLRDMSKARINQNHPHFTNKIPRKSSHHNTESLYNSPNNYKASDIHFPRIDPPRKSSRTNRKTIYKPSPKQINTSVSSDFVFQDAVDPVWLKPQSFHALHFSFGSDLSTEAECSEEFDDHAGPCSGSCSGKLRSSAADIVLDLEETESETVSSEPDLPPISTKPIRQKITEKSRKYEDSSPKSHSTQTTSRPPRKTTSGSRGVKIKGNRDRSATKKTEKDHRTKSMRNRGKKGLFPYSENFAVVKTSFDPVSDFRDSMLEMIAENNIKESRDLEKLLACYLSLNSSQYHDVIIVAFEQIWFGMSHMQYS